MTLFLTLAGAALIILAIGTALRLVHPYTREVGVTLDEMQGYLVIDGENGGVLLATLDRKRAIDYAQNTDSVVLAAPIVADLRELPDPEPPTLPDPGMHQR